MSSICCHFVTDPAWSRSFPTLSVKHLEPIQGYTLLHEDNAHVHTMHAAGRLTTLAHRSQSRNAARSLAAHSQRTRTRDGLEQPFPAEVSLSFYAWGQLISLPNMRLSTEMYGPNSFTTVESAATGTTSKLPNVLQSYYLMDAERRIEATATLQPDGQFHALINSYDEAGNQIDSIQVEPLHMHSVQPQSDPSVMEQLEEEAPHGMVAFRHADLTDAAKTKECGAAVPPPEDDPAAPVKMHFENVSSVESLLNGAGSHRRRLSAIGDGVTRWVNCYPGDTTTHKVSIGIGADVGYYEMYNDLTKAQSAISAVMANINLVYKANFNVFLQVNDVLVQTTTGGLAWNNKPATKGGRCSTSINSALDTFTSWRRSAQAKRNGLWHLFTNWSESMNSAAAAAAAAAAAW